MPPTNQTKLEGEKVQFSCEAKALPGNVTVKWFREGAPVAEVAALETRVTIRRDGALVINPVAADDSGQYLCEVSNGIGDPQSASAYLNVECKQDYWFLLLKSYCQQMLILSVFCSFLIFKIILVNRSSKSNVHANSAVPSISTGRRGAVLHKSESAAPIRNMDQG